MALSPDDRDTVVDLHAAFTRCYDQGGFVGKIDYRRKPPVPMSEQNLEWLDTLLKQHKLR
jgi:hypothetical protein